MICFMLALTFVSHKEKFHERITLVVLLLWYLFCDMF